MTKLKQQTLKKSETNILNSDSNTNLTAVYKFFREYNKKNAYN